MLKRVFKALALASLLAIAPAASAQTVGAPLQVRTGEVYTVDLTYTQTATLGGENVEATMRQVYALHIVDAGQRRWRYVPVSMTYDIPTGLGIDASAVAIDWDAASDALSAFLRVATDVGFDCRVDEYGRCVDMTNWRIWSDRAENLILMGDAFARMAPAPAAAETPTPAPTPAPPRQEGRMKPGHVAEEFEVATPTPPPFNWAQIRAPMLQGLSRLLDGYNSQDAASMMAGIYMPSFVQGRTLTRRQTVSLVDEYEMPFGAPPLRFNSTLTLDRIDQRNNTAIVARTSTLDVESARASSRAITSFVSEALVQPVAAAAGGEAPPSAEAIQQMLESMLSTLSYEENTTGVVDLSTGMARETTTNFTVSVASMGPTNEPLQMHGRIVTRVTAGAPAVPRLPRQ